MEINPISMIGSPLGLDSAVRPNGPETIQATVAAVRALNKSGMFGEDRQLLFERDADTRKPVIKIVSRKTGEVVDQIPPEDMLKIMADLAKQDKGAE